nr:hypothetical protein 20 [bacterium]
MSNVNEALFDASVRHMVGIYRLSRSEARKVTELFNTTQEDILKKLAGADITDFSRKRLESLLSHLKELNAEAYKILEKSIAGNLTDIGVYEAEYQEKLLKHSIPFNVAITRPTLEQIRSIIREKPLEGRFIKDEVGDLGKANIKRIEQSIRIGLLEGETTPQIVRRLRGTAKLGYKDGLLNRSRGDVERLVRTAVNHVSTRARDELYQNNKSLVKAWRFTATLDSRTSVVCASLDGQTFDIGTGPQPPRHPNCRSTTTPILKSWEEMGLSLSEADEGTRASMNGQVPESTTYQTWLKNQDRQTVEEVLGKTKAKLFLDGNLPLDRFIDYTGAEYTLSELKLRETATFARIK